MKQQQKDIKLFLEPISQLFCVFSNWWNVGQTHHMKQDRKPQNREGGGEMGSVLITYFSQGF